MNLLAALHAQPEPKESHTVVKIINGQQVLVKVFPTSGKASTISAKPKAGR